jgi:hypothetical protein
MLFLLTPILSISAAAVRFASPQVGHDLPRRHLAFAKVCR